MLTAAFWRDALERAIKTAAQSALLLFAGDQVNAFHVDWADTAGVAAGGAVLSLLMSMASSGFGDPTTASLVAADDTPPQT